MANINFPSSPINGQQYSVNGVYYYYDSTIGAWLTSIISRPLDASLTTQIIFNDIGYSNGSYGMTFNKTANTAYFNNVAITQNVSATYFKGNGSFLTGVASDLSPAYNTANAAFGRANTSAQLAYFRVTVGATNMDAGSNAGTFIISNSNNIVLIANASNDSLQITQAPSGVTATTYGGSTNIPTFAVDAYGRITSAANVAVSSGGLSIGTVTSDTTTFYPVITSNTGGGSISSANVDTTDLYFVPSTGTLSAKAFNSLSDRELKDNIDGFNGIDLLNKIDPVTFTWKSSGTRSYGVIAQDLEKIMPELVETNDQGIKSVSYIPLIAILMDVIQKQQVEIEEIKTRLNMENKR